mgnify:CR=1 FL=1
MNIVLAGKSAAGRKKSRLQVRFDKLRDQLEKQQRMRERRDERSLFNEIMFGF